MKSTCFILSLLTLLSCKDNQVKPSNDLQVRPSSDFEVKIAGPGTDCGLTLIDFKNDDLAALELITDRKGWTRRQAFNLDKKFNQIGQVIIVTVRMNLL